MSHSYDMKTASEPAEEGERQHNFEVSNGDAGGRSGAAKSLKDEKFKQCVCQRVTVRRGVLVGVGCIWIASVFITGFGVRHLSGNKDPCPSAGPCPENWESYGRTCYYVTKEEGDWNSRERLCASHNAALLVIDSQEELDFLHKHYSETEPFIGLHKKGDGYQWVNGSAYNYSLFHLQPTGECAHLNPVLIISLGGCHLPRTGICKKRMSY